ncbi:hypothetical protein CCAX7_65800 [Capsulimonas corticalis]|uniref:Uncharacterized protein n=1 Tax=Capsulimonas corticalis TaxID=2219043 RepID=A0A402CR90_9BACT|nr:hypothetical protein CCAX7_65800 [Capsulimonas corticalis]
MAEARTRPRRAARTLPADVLRIKADRTDKAPATGVPPPAAGPARPAASHLSARTAPQGGLRLDKDVPTAPADAHPIRVAPTVPADDRLTDRADRTAPAGDRRIRAGRTDRADARRTRAAPMDQAGRRMDRDARKADGRLMGRIDRPTARTGLRAVLPSDRDDRKAPADDLRTRAATMAPAGDRPIRVGRTDRADARRTRAAPTDRVGRLTVRVAPRVRADVLRTARIGPRMVKTGQEDDHPSDRAGRTAPPAAAHTDRTSVRMCGRQS